MIFNTMNFHSKYNDRRVADDHGRSRSLRFIKTLFGDHIKH